MRSRKQIDIQLTNQDKFMDKKRPKILIKVHDLYILNKSTKSDFYSSQPIFRKNDWKFKLNQKCCGEKKSRNNFCHPYVVSILVGQLLHFIFCWK
jgi:hypothetical protein